MAASQYVDIRSLFEGSPYALGDPFEYEHENARGAGKPRCGVCLFPLVTGATASNVDADEDLSFIEHTRVKFARKQFQASADRGCTYCARILDFAHGNGAVDFHLCQSYFWRRIEIYRQDFRRGPKDFVFLAPLGKLHEDLNSGKHSSIGRGFGAASIKGTSEDEVLDRARLWWEICSKEHNCRIGPRHDTPSRLLRLEHSPNKVATVVWLVEGMTEPVEYVALSHRWSEETNLVSLINSNRHERIRNGMLSTDLPRLMQDTIYVLRHFGIQYLWIDCLCIIQGDSADWKREAASMASVYKNAAFTISAIHCWSSSDSLFSDPNKALASGFGGELSEGIPVHLEQGIRHPFSYNGMYYRSGVNLDHVGQPHSDDCIGKVVTDVDPSLTLLSRGWVYQEVLLSPRTLYFLANEIMWRCRAITICQCARYHLDSDWAGQSDLKAITHNGETLYYSDRGCKPVASRDWPTIVEDYSSKELTYSQDRLPGLAGIAQEFGVAKGWTYICGLWQEDLSRTFGWTCSSSLDPHAPLAVLSLPTWSWASTTAHVRMDIVCSEELVFQSCHVTYRDGGSPFLGDVEEAVLNVRGDAFPAKLLPPSVFEESYYRHTDKTRPNDTWGVLIHSGIETVLHLDRFLLETSPPPDYDVMCLVLRLGDEGNHGIRVGVHCLVLRGAGRLTGHYERLGMIGIPSYEVPRDWRTLWGVSKRSLALV